ncbi:MAG TPA: class I SAM-dependent methyltransferase [Steroidobacter sp.]
MHESSPGPTPEQLYYENEALWALDLESDPDERARFDLVTGLLPQGLQSILDVGCGNGAFVNRLAGKYARVCGVDRSEAALRFVRVEKQRASADRLPFSEGEFDLVSCMEVLEHLPCDIYDQARRELARVASKWILISVPYRENRRLGLVRCPKCLCEFNRSYHLREFDESTLKVLFDEIDPKLELVTFRTVGRNPRYLGLRTARKLLEPFRSITLPAGVVCPQCGYHRPVQGSSGVRCRRESGLLGRARNLWPHVNQPRWAVALYQR